MLVISRRPEEEIVLSGDIKIKVLATSGNHVRLGIKAPKHVTIHRQEVLQQASAASVKEVDSEEQVLKIEVEEIS